MYKKSFCFLSLPGRPEYYRKTILNKFKKLLLLNFYKKNLTKKGPHLLNSAFVQLKSIYFDKTPIDRKWTIKAL